MQTSNISYQGNNKPQRGSILGAVKDSAVNVGMTAIAGGAMGAGIGKLASLTPYKPSGEAIKFQYADMFQKAANDTKIPEYLKNLGDDIVEITTKGQISKKTALEAAQNAQKASILANAVSKTPDIVNNDEFLDELSKLAKTKKEEIKVDNIGEKLQNIYSKATEKLKSATESLQKCEADFVDKIGSLKNETIEDMATKGAKHLRGKAVVGAGIAIGVMGALILNVLKTYGVIGRKKTQKTDTINPQSAAFDKQVLQTHQG